MPTNPTNTPLPSPNRTTAPNGAQGHIRKLHDLIGRVDGLEDRDARALIEEVLRSIMQLHSAGLRRMLDVAASDPGLLDRLVNDGTLRSVLLAHDLHPASIEDRLKQALDKVLPYIRSHGGDVQLVEVVDGTVRLKLQGTCQTCPSSSVTLDLAVRAAIEEFCPDLVGFEVVAPDTAQEPVKAPAEKLVCIGEAVMAAG